MTTLATVNLAAGTGHIVRRPDSLLFVPSGDERLVRAFTDAPDGGELQSVATATVEAGFEVPPFVAIQWGDRLRVMAFGDVEVETDLPTLPMLSGAGSRTWVEHSAPSPTEAQIDVSSAEIDALTDLAHGVAVAGGFRIALYAGAEQSAPPRTDQPWAPSQRQPTADDATAGGAAPEPTEPAGADERDGDASDRADGTAATTDVTTDGDTANVDEAVAPATDADRSDGASPGQDQPPPDADRDGAERDSADVGAGETTGASDDEPAAPSDTAPSGANRDPQPGAGSTVPADSEPLPLVAGGHEDPKDTMALIAAAAVDEGGQPVGITDDDPIPGPTADPVFGGGGGDPDDDIDSTLPPDAASDLREELTGSSPGHPSPDQDGGTSYVEAKLCAEGHASPPTAAVCDVCGAFLPPSSTTVQTVERPALGSLRLDDGQSIELVHPVLFGRNPQRDTNADHAHHQLVKVGGDKVSRVHVEVRLTGWDVLVADCGSTNGTFVLPHPGGQLLRLEAERLQRIEPGAEVYFGSRSFRLLDRSAQ